MKLKWDVESFFCSANPGDPLDPLKHLCKGRLGLLTLSEGFNRCQLGMKRKKTFLLLGFFGFVLVLGFFFLCVDDAGPDPQMERAEGRWEPKEQSHCDQTSLELMMSGLMGCLKPILFKPFILFKPLK